jgi:hypothetical protein
MERSRRLTEDDQLYYGRVIVALEGAALIFMAASSTSIAIRRSLLSE